MFYVLSMVGVKDTVRSLKKFGDDPYVEKALSIIRRDFSLHDGLGPMDVAGFKADGLDDATKADVVGFVKSLLGMLEYGS